MAEPTASTTTTIAILSAVSMTSILNIEIGIVLGALCGATLLAISQKTVSLLQRSLFFVLSFFLGLFLNDFFIYIMALILPEHIIKQAPEGFGALIASAISVKILLGLIDKSDYSKNLLKILKKRK